MNENRQKNMEFFHPLNLNQYSDILIIFKLYHNHHIGHFETIIILNHPNPHHAPPPKKKTPTSWEATS